MGLPFPEGVFQEGQAMKALKALWKGGKAHGAE